MPVTVKTFATSGEAAAALSSERDARYLGGGTLVMRALNEGDLSVSTVVRATDRALTQIEFASSRITIGAGVTFARVLAERELAFLHPVARLDRRPRRAQHGHGRRQSVRANAVRRFCGRAAGARRHRRGAGRLWCARRADRGVPCRARSPAGRARAFRLLPAPSRRSVSLSQDLRASSRKADRW